MITYAYSPYLCADLKIYLLLGLLFIGVSGYTIIEFLEFRKQDVREERKTKKGKFELVDNQIKSGEVADWNNRLWLKCVVMVKF